MNNLRQVKSDISRNPVSAGRATPSKKIAVCLTAALGAAVMIAWLSFLGWAVYAVFFWLRDYPWVIVLTH
jgi:hypothetical protein